MLLGENEIGGYGFNISQEELLFREYAFGPGIFLYSALSVKADLLTKVRKPEGALPWKNGIIRLRNHTD